MAALSTFARATSKNLQILQSFQHKLISKNVIIDTKNAISLNQIRTMSSEMFITASRWQWHKTKDWVHFYVFLMGVPLGIITLYANVFIGPATLTEIPENYTPKYWEYYRHPISRFLARYFFCSPQKDYEKTLHMIYLESQQMEARRLENKVYYLQKERQDMKYRYFDSYELPKTRRIRQTQKDVASLN